MTIVVKIGGFKLSLRAAPVRSCYTQMARSQTSTSSRRGRLPSCKWAKIIKRSQKEDWRTEIRIVGSFIDTSSGRKRVTVVWNDNGDKITYDASWLDRKQRKAKVISPNAPNLGLLIDSQVNTVESDSQKVQKRTQATYWLSKR